MKKKGIITASILLPICMFILTGYSYSNQIELKSDKVIVELGNNIDNNVATYANGEIDKATLDLSKVNSNEIGEYQATIQNEDQVVNFTIQVKDTTKPKLTGIKNKTIFVGDRFNYLLKVTATDNLDGNITKKIKVNKKTVNLKKAGIYNVTYTVCDSSGNKAIKEMKLTVKKDKAPVLKGIKNKTVYLNNSINYLNGVKAIDDRDGNITKKIKVNKSNVNIFKIGTYKVTYSVTDSKGNTTKKTISLKVKQFELFDVEQGGKQQKGDSNASGEPVGTW